MLRRTFLAALVSSTLMCGPGFAEPLTRVRIGFIPVSDFMPIFVAKDQGFFEKNKLDASLVQMANQQVILSALVAGDAEVGTTTAIKVLQADEAGIELTAVAGTQVTPIPTYSIVAARAGSGIAKPADLVGKKLAVNSLNEIHHVIVTRWLREAGVDPKRVTFVEVTFPQMADVLKSGQVDAVMTTDPFARRIIDQKIGVEVGKPFESTPDGTSTSMYAVTRAWAKANPRAVAGFQAALKEAVDFIRGNEEAARASLGKWTKQPPEVVRTTAMPNLQPVLTKAQLDFWLQETARQGVTKGTADTAALTKIPTK